MTSEAPGWKPLYVSSIVGGDTAGNRPIREASQRLARAVDAVAWSDDKEETGIDVVFHHRPADRAAGLLGDAPGTLSRKRRLITVQVAVPVELEGGPADKTSRPSSWGGPRLKGVRARCRCVRP